MGMRYLFTQFILPAGIAQLGERQTEALQRSLLEVPCSIHGGGSSFAIFTKKMFEKSCFGLNFCNQLSSATPFGWEVPKLR